MGLISDLGRFIMPGPRGVPQQGGVKGSYSYALVHKAFKAAETAASPNLPPNKRRKIEEVLNPFLKKGEIYHPTLKKTLKKLILDTRSEPLNDRITENNIKEFWAILQKVVIADEKSPKQN
ncbi:MAG: hypothetical protein HY602_00985 [Parcubacteria group bacterium]|nr:hypothetical protein [Parcubacteria group bacterium]